MRLLSLVWCYALAATACERHSVGPGPVPRTSTAIRRELLMRHAVRAPLLQDAYASMATVMASYAPPDLRTTGVNPSFPGDGDIALYVVDGARALADEAVCGSGESLPGLCVQWLHVTDNCVVVDATTIACDARFIARLAAEALAAGLGLAALYSAGGNPAVLDQLPGQYEIVRTIEEAAGLEGKLALLDRMWTRARAVRLDASLREFTGIYERGFFEFLLVHELGHVVLNHQSGGFLPLCATESEMGALPTAVRTQVRRLEAEADDYAIGALTRSLRVEMTAYPALLMFEHVRLAYHAALAEGLDLDVIFAERSLEANQRALDALPPEQLDRFNARMQRLMCNGSHPSYALRAHKILAAQTLSAEPLRRALWRRNMQPLESMVGQIIVVSECEQIERR